MSAPSPSQRPLPQRIADWVRGVFGDRFDQSPISTTEQLADFIGKRAAYIAQTALFGYLKTRMGTSFRHHFEDEKFSTVIRESAAKLFISCLSDLTIFAVATASQEADLDDESLVALANHCFKTAFTAGMADAEAPETPEEAFTRFAARARETDWHAMAQGEAAFAGSVADLVRFAPVIDEFKDLDREIVRNSIRFRWRDVREQIRKRADGVAIGTDWRALIEDRS